MTFSSTFSFLELPATGSRDIDSPFLFNISTLIGPGQEQIYTKNFVLLVKDKGMGLWEYILSFMK